MLGGFAPLPLRHSPNALTGWSAATHARAAADLVAVKRAAALAWLTYTSTGAGVTLGACSSQFEVGTASALAPTLTREATGVVLVTFLPQVADEYDISGAISIRSARAAGHATALRRAVVQLVSPNSVRVRLFDSSGAIDGRVTLRVA